MTRDPFTDPRPGDVIRFTGHTALGATYTRTLEVLLRGPTRCRPDSVRIMWYEVEHHHCRRWTLSTWRNMTCGGKVIRRDDLSDFTG